MDRVTDRATIARLNIEHYKHLLATETDEIKREKVLRVLAEEQEILAKIVREAAQPWAEVAWPAGRNQVAPRSRRLRFGLLGNRR
jgi:hypothetical protein